MSNDRNQLLEQANLLGLEFPNNIPSAKLQIMVEEAENALPSEIPDPVEEVIPPSPAAVPDKKEVDEVDEATAVVTTRTSKALRKRLRIKQAREEATKKRIVTITNKDNRDNDVTTTAYLSFENQYFGISKNVPLDIPVELEQALIDTAAACTMPLHKDEIKDGKRTGNKTTVMVNKYVISYSSQDPK